MTRDLADALEQVALLTAHYETQLEYIQHLETGINNTVESVDKLYISFFGVSRSSFQSAPLNSLANALEQVALLTAQNARLAELNARHTQQLEQLCTERDAARELFREAMQERDDVQELLELRNAVRK